MLCLEGHHLFPDLPFGDRLEVPVERRDHRQPAVLEQLLSVGFLQLRRYPVNETGRLDVVGGGWLLQREFLSGRGLRLGRRDFADLDHRIQHDALPRPSTVEVGERIQRGWRLRKTGEQGRL